MWTLPTGQQTMTDIHMHLIPGVDDGAVDFEMAMDMLRLAKEQGISSVFAASQSSAYDTAHDGQRTRENFSRLRELAEQHFPGMGVYLGCEVYCGKRFMKDVLRNLRAGCYPTMNGSKYVLTEFSMWTSREDALECVTDLAAEGWIPVIAHMERYRYLRQDMELVDSVRRMGGRIQINAYSLSGETDLSILSWARRLAQEQKADFLGTDAHRTSHRPPSAAEGLRWLYNHCPKDYADNLAFRNAGVLLEE